MTIKLATDHTMIRLKAFVQEYDWGKTGSNSLAARLAPNAIGQDFQVDESKSYAEIWMGTHQNGEAHLFSDPTTSLLSLVSSDPERYLGEAILRKWPGNKHLPFLFKILSIEKALPLQVHPDREIAQRLAKEDPKTFVDSNHKPEIAIAIGEPIGGGVWGAGIAFTGFVGFQPLRRIHNSLKYIPELRQAIGKDDLVDAFLSDPSKETLKPVYAALLNRPQDIITPIVHSLVDRIASGDWPSRPGFAETAELVFKINQQYPADVGVLSTVFFMNFFKKRRGEALYIGADEIHAYLEGDIIECMAVSDNVLNVAFVPPEERQVKEFVDALTFTSRTVDHWNLEHEQYERSKQGRTQVYNPPLEEFIVLRTSLRNGEEETLEAVHGPTIGIVTRGRVKVTAGEFMMIETGSVIFVPPNTALHVELVDGDEAEIWFASFTAN